MSNEILNNAEEFQKSFEPIQIEQPSPVIDQIEQESTENEEEDYSEDTNDLEEQEDSSEDETLDEESETLDEKKDEEKPLRKPEIKNRAQKRINELTREKYELRKQLEDYRRQQSYNNQVAYNTPEQNYYTKPTESVTANFNNFEKPKPRHEDYDDDVKYIEDLTDWKLEQKEKTAIKLRQQSEFQNKISRFEEQEKKAMAEIDDYESTILNTTVMVNNAIPEALLESEHGARIKYYLMKNPSEAQKTLTMTPTQAIKFVGRLETKIENEIKNSKMKRVSNAPPPVKSVRTSTGGNLRFNPNDDNIPIDEWMKKRNSIK